jgi:hypothetical protein
VGPDLRLKILKTTRNLIKYLGFLDMIRLIKTKDRRLLFRKFDDDRGLMGPIILL